ncbi:MAG: YigZ family protein [Bacteroidetes bacterium]|nr:YigZ family protein [Bacteroidota bacterium]MBU1371623.1 YigZ family protein [Bacteroidota bacterium]MBU1486199.1 YigZ family protein [Bacteroidota bacterium]MBU1761962.1 YigZ family protein [Bacteroidota bacterium]MBU2046930.1 YigZ family protein [Bacteroidota bacterium]
MLFEDTYRTINQPSEGIFRDKGSKFIAYTYPFKSEEHLKDIISELKNQHAKARHFCYAYRLTTDRSVFRINDDGEPSGTAGRPILNTLLSHDLTNILIVVVRYFGGTLLGVPGLINAYKSAAEDAVQCTSIIEKRIQDVYLIDFEYLHMNEVMKLIKDEDLESFDQDFDLKCKIKITINQSDINRIIGKLESIENLKSQYLKTI